MEGVNKKILIVEDEPSMSRVLVDELSRAGFNVLWAKNGQDGLEISLRQRPDLILLDIIMPRMNGMTMLKKLRKKKWGRDVPVIILTNLSDPRSVIDALEFDGVHIDTREKITSLPEKINNGVKKYLEKRLGGGNYEFLIKSDLGIKELLKKVKEKLDLV